MDTITIATRLHLEAPQFPAAFLGIFIRNLILIFVCALCAQTHSAEENKDLHTSSDIHVNMYVDQAQASIGDEIIVHIEFQWPQDWDIDSENSDDPSVFFTNAGVFLLKAPPVVRTLVGSMQHEKWQLTVLCQSSGAWSLPRAPFTAIDPSGTTHSTQAPKVIIQIGIEKNPPLLADPSALWSSADSNDAGVHSRLWLWIILAVALIAGLVFFLLPKKVAEIVLSPIDRFQESFLRSQATDNGKEAAAELSQGLRRFCGHLWEFDGAAATNREMRDLLVPHITSTDLRHVCMLLDSIEDVRWTAADAQLSQVHSLAGDARNWCSTQYTHYTERQDQIQENPEVPS